MAPGRRIEGQHNENQQDEKNERKEASEDIIFQTSREERNIHVPLLAQAESIRCWKKVNEEAKSCGEIVLLKNNLVHWLAVSIWCRGG
jgi:hypothetical protein